MMMATICGTKMANGVRAIFRFWMGFVVSWYDIG